MKDVDEIQHLLDAEVECPKKGSLAYNCEGYLKYLDLHFKPEISLTESSDPLTQPLPDSKWSEEQGSEQTKPVVNLNYRGNKHMFNKGKYSERRDVLYKTLMRTVRRFLWEMFESEAELHTFCQKKRSNEFYDALKKFYEKHVKCRSVSCSLLTQEQEEEQIMYLGVLMTNSYN